MSKSQRVRLREVRTIYRLLGECCEQGSQAEAWYRHLLLGAGRLVGAPVTTGGQVAGWNRARTSDALPQPILVLDMGWRDYQTHDLFQAWLRFGDVRTDLLYARLCEGNQRLRTRYRRQVVSDGEWYLSEHYNDYRRHGGTDDCLYSVATFPGGDLVQSIALHRPPGDRPFGDRERHIIHWLHHELMCLVGGPLVSPHEDDCLKLSPRLRQTLQCLLEGDSEKQAALRLNISRSTVHDYVKQLYRRFGVHSRSELLALWMKRYQPPTSTSDDSTT